MKYTISTHNGSAVSRQHNLRNGRVTSKEPHINPDGVHETWIDEAPQVAYRRIFGKAQDEYNARQSRSDRLIPNYYLQVARSDKQHAVYEMIACVGRKGAEPPPEVGKQILREYAAGWKEANPNLELIGCYYHADELGVQHIHLDYIPVAHGYKRGLETQAGLVKSLGEMGFHIRGRETAQIQWERSENKRLESICRAHGLEIEHPREEGRQHLDTRTYKAEKRVEKLRDRAERAHERIRVQEERATRFEERADQLGCDLATFKRLEARLEAVEERYKALREFCSHYSFKDAEKGRIGFLEAFERAHPEPKQKHKVQESFIEL